MRLPLLLALVATSLTPICVQAQSTSTAPPGVTLPDFDAQKRAMASPRIGTLDELRSQGHLLIGKTVELHGTIKAVFGRSEGVSFLLQFSDGSTQNVSASASFKSAPAIHLGNWVRALSLVQATVGADAVLQLVNITTKPDPNSPNEDSTLESVVPNVPGAPTPDQIIQASSTNDGVIIGPEVELPPPPPYSPPRASVAPRTQRPATRPRKAAPARGGNIFFGFDDSSRAAFKSLAMRNNPRLGEESADNIAFSLLEASQAQNLDPRFLAAIVQVESEFNPNCVSSAGAMGLGQLMPFNLRPLGVANAWDPRQNLHGAAKLLRKNLNVYANDRNGTMLAVAAYHAGVGAVNRAGRAIPKATTQRYVWKVYYAYRALAPELFH